MALKMKTKDSVLRKPYRIVLTGVAGSGKSTAMGTIAKKALILDTDKRFPRSLVERNDFAAFPETYKGLKEYLGEILAESKLENDLIVIDTCTKLCTFIEAWVIQQDMAGSREKFAAYGHGNKFLHQYFQEVLDLLDKIQEKHQVNVAFVAHSKLKALKSASTDGDYIKNQLDLPEIVADRLLQWCDACAFVFFEVPTDDKHKVKGPARRVVTLTDAPVHTAKNGLPWALPEKIDFDINGKWAQLAFTGSYDENRALVQQIDALIESYPAAQRSEIRSRFETIGYRTMESKLLQPYLDAAKAAKVAK